MPRVFWGRTFGNRTPGPPAFTGKLTVVDNANGTGATATIVGSSGTVTFYAMPFAGFVWAPAGTRVGDGALVLPLAPGSWLVVAVGQANIAAPVLLQVTTGKTAVATRAQDAIVARIGTLTMAGNPNQRILEEIIENEKIMQVPCVFVVFAGLVDTEVSSLNNMDDISYQFRVSLVDRCHPDDSVNRARYQLWREQISRALRWQRLAGVSESLVTKVRYGQAGPAKGAAFALFVSEIFVEAVCREPRG